MNNVSIRIIDTLDNSHITSDQYARASSLRLGWKGGDNKDGLFVVGSYLKFTLISLDCKDGVFYDLFTGNETRYRVEYCDEDTQEIFWQGFLLPDAYEEPYKVGPIDVDFMATDGLGRLKGKFLPDDYYKEEKSVIDILAQCLKLTGLELDFRFAPAIENSQVKDYNLIYINTENFNLKETRQDAHQILDDLLTSMLCVVYQSENMFNIEGVNVREQRVYTAKKYDKDGVFISEDEITRNIKAVTPVATPEITMQPPVGYLSLTHKGELFSLPEGLSSETNDGWTYRTEAIETYNSTRSQDKESYIYASEWYPTDGFHAYSSVDNKVFFGNPSLAFPAGDQRIDLNYRPYIKAGQKYKLKFEFEIVPFSDDAEVNKSFVENGDWQNPFQYDFAYYAYPESTYIRIIGNGIIASNPQYFPLNFGTGDKQKVTVEFQYIPKYSGDFITTIHPLDTGNGIEKVYINELSLTLIGEEEDKEVSGNLLEGWSTRKEAEIVYTDDVNGLGKTFRLKKLKEPFGTQDIENSIIRTFTYKGQNMVSVPLYAANLVDENKDRVYKPTVADPNVLEAVTVKEVIFNYNNSDEHIVITENPVTTGKLVVSVQGIGKPQENRQYWEEWSDTLYKVERENYLQTAYNIHKRLLNKELPSILNLTVKNNVKFNDFIKFTYNSKNDFILTDCEVDIDKGFSNVSIVQKYYITEGQYSPVVELGGPLYLDEDTGTLTADAFDPDGIVVSYDWEEVTNTGASINPYGEQADITLPTGVNYAVFRVTVTDNDGNTGSDEIEVYRISDITVSLTEIFSEVSGNFKDKKHYRLDLSPDLPDDMSVTVSGVLKLRYHASYFMQSITMYGEVSQNSAITTQLLNNYSYATDAPETIQVGDNNNVSGKSIYFNFNYIKGDTVVIKLEGEFDDNNQNSLPIDLDGSVDITEIAFNDGFGQVLGLPLNKTIALNQLT